MARSARIRSLALCGFCIAHSLPAHAAATDFSFLGFAQLTAEAFESDDGIDFGGDRVRVKGTYQIDKISAELMLELNADNLSDRPAGTFPNLIGDLSVSYQFHPKHQLKVGQFKTPVGLDFNVSGHRLHITKRGMEAGLVLSRDIGVMVSGRDIAERFGYDVGVFNVAGRSSATLHEPVQEGDDNAWAVRGMYDEGPWHFEASLGGSQDAGGDATADYRLFDLAASYSKGAWTAIVEWIDSSNVRGATNRDERVIYGHAGWRLNPRVELVLRHYYGESALAGLSSDLTNTYVGANLDLFRHDGVEGRLQLNYVFASGDESAYTGVRGFTEDALLLQFQWLISR